MPAPAPSAPFGGAFQGARVLVTGHTGFKGAWLALWLERLGAEVAGLALDPEPGSLYELAGVGAGLADLRVDVRDRPLVLDAVRGFAPDLVLHLAAQALVRRSYDDPAATWETNVMGTVNVLEAVRACPGVRAAVVVSSDKCYENPEQPYAFRETDPLGGVDPYSASKGATELVAASYRRALLAGRIVPSARAGNVIGGGDRAEARIVPDCVRALEAGQPIPIRTPGAVRPWQHVLEPLSGYLLLAARALAGDAAVNEGWNFGPDAGDHRPVADVAAGIVARWGAGSWAAAPPAGPPRPEAHVLRLDVTKAAVGLGWRPVYDLDAALDATVGWYRAQHEQGAAFDARAATLAQIAAYEAAARAQGLAWA